MKRYLSIIFTCLFTRIFTGILTTATLLIVLVACGGTTTDPKPIGPKESFKSTATLTASNAAANDEFGNAVAISGDYAIVGAHRNDARARNSGSAYIYKRNGATWTEIQTLLPSDDSGVNFFGKSVDILGDYAVVGALSAPAPTSNLAGAAYIYKRNNDSWSEVAKLNSRNAGFVDEFGVSLAMSDTYIIVGAHNNDELGNNAGSAYIFERNGDSFSEVSKLTASDGKEQDKFGTSVAIHGDYAVVGAFTSDVGPKSGAVYIYKRSGSSGSNWTEITKLKAKDANGDDRFGDAVAINDDFLIVVAPLAGSGAGFAYVYKRNGDSWTEVAKLTDDNGRSIDFATSVDMSGSYLILGIVKTGNAGSALTFKRSGDNWTLIDEVAAGNVTGDDRFGFSVGISGEQAIVGAFSNDDIANNAGAAYIFEKISE